MRCLGKSAVAIAITDRVIHQDIVRHALMSDGGVRFGRLPAIRDRCQRLVVDPDPRNRIFGNVAVSGNYHSDGIAHIANFIAREDEGSDIGTQALGREPDQFLY